MQSCNIENLDISSFDLEMQETSRYTQEFEASRQETLRKLEEYEKSLLQEFKPHEIELRKPSKEMIEMEIERLSNLISHSLMSVIEMNRSMTYSQWQKNQNKYHATRAHLYYQLDRLEEALADCNQIYVTLPINTQILKTRILHQLGRHAEALIEANKVLLNDSLKPEERTEILNIRKQAINIQYYSGFIGTFRWFCGYRLSEDDHEHTA